MSDGISLLKQLSFELGSRALQGRKRRHVLQQVFWECTLRCNLRCRHCGSDCRMDCEVEDMPIEMFLPVLDEVAIVAKPSETMIITTGGEPLLRKDIAKCGREITQRGFIWGMVSNGMLLTEEKLDELISAGLKSIAISLDGFEKEHNWMRGNSRSFHHAVGAIKALTKKNITWDVITCVNQQNFSTLEQLRDFLIDIGVKHWCIFTVFPAGRGKDDPEMQLQDDDYRKLMDFIVQERKWGAIDLSYSCEGFLGRYEKRVRDYQYFCQAGINVASILADGSISGCLSIRSDYYQGNIRSDSFADVWRNGFQLYRNREWMKAGECAECCYWKYCEGNGMHLRDGDGGLMMCNHHRL